MTEATDQPSQNLEQLIVGTWDWKYTDVIGRGIRPPNDRVTPESTGHTGQQRFLEDGRVQLYKDGQITETHLYTIEIEYKPMLPGPGPGPRFHICIGRGKQEFLLTGDTLEMWPMGAGACGWHLASDA